MAELSVERRQAIEAGLRAGESIGKVSRRVGCAKATASKIAHAIGVVPNVQATKKASEARRDFALANRLDILNAGFEKAQTILTGIQTPQELQQWTVAVGTLIDKRRLEDGEATSRTEDTGNVRDRLAGRLDELAARRRTAGPVGEVAG